MAPPDPTVSVADLLRAFNGDQIYLLLGAAITTIGLLAAAFSLLRRRLDSLLLWFALFALLYGVRLVMEYQLLWAVGLRPPLFLRFVVAIAYLVPIPAFFFFQELDLLGRVGRIVSNIVWPVALCLALATLAFGPQNAFETANNVLVSGALAVLVIALLRVKGGAAEITLIRRGLLFFIVCALYNNVFAHLLPRYYNIEPFSFIVLLACLGVVAGRRTLAQEQQLSVIQKELEIAQRIQLSILPTAFPASTSFRVAARYLPMTSVAGDFYDFLLATDTEAGLLIADVSGHGVPAALIASMVKLAATSQRGHASCPSDLLHNMNAALCGNTQTQFVTAAYVYLNAATGELRYSAAAHPPMLLLRNEEVTAIEENGLMLAAFPFAAYSTVTQSLEPGDRLLLYTDGILEAADAHEQEFGAARLHHLLRETVTLPHTEAADRIITTIQQWSATQNDDLTVLVCDYAT